MLDQGFLQQPGGSLDAEEELHLTPRPDDRAWEGEHGAGADLAHPLDEALFSNSQGTHPSHQVHHAPASHAALPHSHLGPHDEVSSSMRYVIFDEAGELQEAHGGQTQGTKKGEPREAQQGQERGGVQARSPPRQQAGHLHVEKIDGNEPVDLREMAECKACKGFHMSHTCGVRGKRAVQPKGSKRPPAVPAPAAVVAHAKFKNEPPPSVGVSVGGKRELDRAPAPKKSPPPSGLRTDSKRPPLARPAAEGTTPFAVGASSSSRPNSRSPEHPPTKVSKTSEGKPALSPHKAEGEKDHGEIFTPPPPPPPPPPAPKPLPCCTYECCPNPLHTSGGWKRVTSETRAGARDWTAYEGRLFCNACFTQYATTGSMTRKGRPQQENPYLAGGPMQIPHEKPKEERHERVHAGGMALRPSITQTNRIDLE